MKLSEILGWIKKKEEDTNNSYYWKDGWNTALTSCDREIDREALARAIFDIQDDRAWESVSEEMQYFAYKEADYIISNMPTWLKRIKE